ncbi:hypothetical protein HPB48_019007 [Haemaphysalis longicornis]|uniref:Uncharacterized protein n=1 Tax=Haemaphysalis longicornis TaxID=44386 RepID=A0A9J6GHQ3_HAELO|nr:hypothetical protein HPB48_019007 [Haemaphysalis longicornis]
MPLLHHSTAAALRYLVLRGRMDKEALTTAFFLEQVFRWFTLMTSRSIKTALSDLSAQRADEAKSFLEDFIAMFSGLTVVDKDGKDPWKPVQTGAVLSTLSALALRALYITKHGFRFLMLSRLTQDALENLFSTIRFRTPIPRAREFKSTFRVIALAQFSQPSRHGSYQVDDSQYLLEFVRDKKELARDCTDDVVDVGDDEIVELCQEEQDSLMYFSGYIAYAVIQKHSLCPLCKACLVDKDKEVPELVALKCYTKHGRNPLKVPSGPLVQLLEDCERLFRVNEDRLLNSKCTLESLKKFVKEKVRSFKNFPVCHSVAEKATAHFFLCRLRFAVKQRNVYLLDKMRQSGKCGSKSVGMRVLAQNVT